MRFLLLLCTTLFLALSGLLSVGHAHNINKDRAQSQFDIAPKSNRGCRPEWPQVMAKRRSNRENLRSGRHAGRQHVQKPPCWKKFCNSKHMGTRKRKRRSDIRAGASSRRLPSRTHLSLSNKHSKKRWVAQGRSLSPESKTLPNGTASQQPGNVPPSETSPSKPISRIMLVLDASGSMRQKIGGKRKIDIARKMLKGLLRNWSPTIHLGLTVYGHRGKGCRDIQVMVPVSKPNTAKILRIVNQIKPRGSTPMTKAVLLAAKSMRYKEKQSSIILISDGEETCRGNTCSMGKVLKAQGSKFVAHVIGFKVGRKARKQLQCMAKNTGGMYLSANNPKALLQALNKAVEKVKKESAGIKLEVVQQSNSSRVTEKIRWEVYLEGNAPGQRGKKIRSFSSATPTLSLKPGRYIAVAYRGTQVMSKAFSVLSNKATTVTIQSQPRVLPTPEPLEPGKIEPHDLAPPKVVVTMEALTPSDRRKNSRNPSPRSKERQPPSMRIVVSPESFGTLDRKRRYQVVTLAPNDTHKTHRFVVSPEALSPSNRRQKYQAVKLQTEPLEQNSLDTLRSQRLVQSSPPPKKSVGPTLLLSLGGSLFVGGGVTSLIAATYLSSTEKLPLNSPAPRTLTGVSTNANLVIATGAVVGGVGLALGVGGLIWMLLPKKTATTPAPPPAPTKTKSFLPHKISP